MSQSWTRLRPSAGLPLMLEIAGHWGVDAERLLNDTGVSLTDLDDAWLQITGVQEVQVVRNLLSALPQVPHLGLLLGMRHHSGTDGPIGLAAVTAANLRAAAAVSAEFFELTGAMVAAFDISSGRESGISYSTGTLPADVVEFYLQREVATFVAITREALGNPDFSVSGELPWPAPPDQESLDAYVAALGQLPRFGQPAAALRFADSWLDTPFPRSNARTHLMMLDQCRRELKERHAKSLVSGHVREIIAQRLAEGPSVESVAREMMTSTRTLRRQLQQEGAAFREILDSVRADTAEELLRHSTLSISQISVRLGYENPPAFSTAFRRWHNLTPRDFRMSHQS